MARGRGWLKLFEQFVADIRIVSKEVVSDDPRGVPLVLWESQRRFLREVGDGLDGGVHQFNCLKSRQLGVTTVSLAIDVFWLAMHDNIIGALVTDTEDNREANRSLITKYVNGFEDGYFGGDFRIVTSNRTMMQFSNGATLRFLVAGTKKKSIAWAEGTGYSLIHLTEVAKYAAESGTAMKSLIEGFAQTNPSRLMIMESTANGYNHWKARYEQGLRDTLTQRSFFIGWWSGDTNRIERKDPRFKIYGTMPLDKEEREKIAAVAQMHAWNITPEQLAWIRWKEHDAGFEQDLLSQNQPWTAKESFVQSGRSFFTVRQINKNLNAMQDSLDAGETIYLYKGYRYIETDDFFQFTMEQLKPEEGDSAKDVDLRIWAEPQPNAKYVIGFDVAYGRNEHKDGNVISVWRCYADKIVQVAEYASYGVDVRRASWVFFHLVAAYGDVMGNLEIGGPGHLVMAEFDHLRRLLEAEHNAEKVKARNWEEAAANARWYLFHKPDSLGAGYIYNFNTTWSTKPRLMHGFSASYITNCVDIRSKKLLDEMTITIVNEDGDIGAPDSDDPDEKDDRVFAAALAHIAWTDWVRNDMLAAGQTFDAVTKEERGETPPQLRGMNSSVYRWLAKQDELADEEPPRGTEFQIKNGLV